MSNASERLDAALKEIGIQAKRSLGQNFLVSDNVVGKIIAQVKELTPEVMIEVGPGPGALTDFLKDMNVPLHLIELDRMIAAYWRTKGLEVIEEDALRMDWQRYYGGVNAGKKIVFVSNLPYQISSSIVIERSLENEGVEHMVLMFQKEVAQRIRAPAQSEHYGLLSVIAQTFWKTWTVCEAGSGDFDPSPRVASRVLGFTRLPPDIVNREKFLKFVKAAFAQRRKLLKKNISGLLSQKQIPEGQFVEWLIELGFKETARAEELSPQQFVILFKKFGFEL